MTAAPTDLDRFLRAVHRRMAILRALESAGLSATLACAAALALLPFLIWHDRPALPLTLLLLGAAASSGLVWGILRRPTPLHAALEADEQLGLADLLSTALTLRNRPSDPWATSVLALADAQCRDLRPSAVVLHRLGLRGWSGIGLGAALVLTLATLASHPSGSSAHATGAASFVRQDQLTDPQPADQLYSRAPTNPASPPRPRTPGAPLDDTSADASQWQRIETEQTPAANVAAPSQLTGASDRTGQGAGIGRTQQAPLTPPTPTNTTAGRRGETRGNQSSGGVASGLDAAPDGAGQAGASSASANAHDRPPKEQQWGGDAGATDPRQAPPARARPVPDAYRDVVRDYFSRH